MREAGRRRHRSSRRTTRSLLLFLCCHPALTPGSAIPLTLRAVGGLTTAEIARAFLVPEATMAQRISRAKATIWSRRAVRDAGARGARAAAARGAPRPLPDLQRGLHRSGGAVLHRVELSDEAIRLTRHAAAAAPGDGEVDRAAGTDAADRRPAPGAYRRPRANWSRCPSRTARCGIAADRRGRRAGQPRGRRGPLGEYQLQAAIAAVHDEAASADETDWPRIVALYERLEEMTGNPVVTVNRAVAVAMVDGPAAGLAVLDEVADELGPSSSARCRASPSPGDGGGARRGDRAVPGGGGAGDIGSRAPLPRDAGRAPR